MVLNRLAKLCKAFQVVGKTRGIDQFRFQAHVDFRAYFVTGSPFTSSLVVYENTTLAKIEHKSNKSQLVYHNVELSFFHV